MTPNVTVKENYLWTNEHNNVSKQVLRRFEVSNAPSTDWRDGLAGIQSMIADARSRKERLRSHGGKWSLSDVAICNDGVHDTRPLTFFGTVGRNSVAGVPLYPDDARPLPDRLFYFQCGSQVNQINLVLEGRGLCLPTTGASNGQTIAGAVSTGTHGSALGIGSMQDYVRALHLVTSESDHVIVQPASNPVVKKSFSDVFGAKLVSDDKLFDAALVSFGSFGIIHGIILEAVSLFTLEAYCLRTDYAKAEQIFGPLGAFDHGSTANLTRFLGTFGLPADGDPYHAQLIVNPHAVAENAFLRVMYKRPHDPAGMSPPPGGTGTRVGDDLLSVVGSIAEAAGALAPALVNLFFDKVVAVEEGYRQTPRNIFSDTTLSKPRQGGASTELGVPIGRAAEAVRLIIGRAQQSHFVGVIGIRFVKNSRALLAFTRFAPLTCTIELPGINSEATQRFYGEVFDGMDRSNIPFTLHWGQEGDYSPRRLTKMYGDAVGEWVAERNRFLPDPLQRYMFTNDFLKRCGLAEAPVLTGGAVIV